MSECERNKAERFTTRRDAPSSSNRSAFHSMLLAMASFMRHPPESSDTAAAARSSEKPTALSAPVIVAVAHPSGTWLSINVDTDVPASARISCWM